MALPRRTRAPRLPARPARRRLLAPGPRRTGRRHRGRRQRRARRRRGQRPDPRDLRHRSQRRHRPLQRPDRRAHRRRHVGVRRQRTPATTTRRGASTTCAATTATSPRSTARIVDGAIVLSADDITGHGEYLGMLHDTSSRTHPPPARPPARACRRPSARSRGRPARASPATAAARNEQADDAAEGRRRAQLDRRAVSRDDEPAVPRRARQRPPQQRRDAGRRVLAPGARTVGRAAQRAARRPRSGVPVPARGRAGDRVAERRGPSRRCAARSSTSAGSC